MARKRQSGRRSDRGFTLIELLVVLVILVLIGGLVGPQVLSYLGGARSDTAGLQMDNIASALDLYRLDNGRYPTGQEGLQALIAAPADARRWDGPYLRGGEVPVDPWDRAYVYTGDGAGFSLSTLGADGIEGGDGENQDIVRTN